MAMTFTPGYAFSTTEQVTAAKLALLVSQASGSGLDQTNLASGYGLVISSGSSPSNTNAIWIDTSTSNTPKYYTGSVWQAIGTGATVTGITGLFRNLVSAWASNTTWTVTADEIIVKDANNNDLRLTSLNSTINSASSNGINALDTGAKANNTIYYIWVFAKADGTKGLVYSTSSTFSTVYTNLVNSGTTGYTYGALVSVLGTNNSGNFIKATQTGRRYSFATWATLASGNVGLTPWVAIDLTPANMTTVAGFVPSVLSTFCYGTLQHENGTSAVTNDSSVSVPTTRTTNEVYAGVGSPLIFPWMFDVITADTLYWASNDAANKVYLHGFELNKIV